MFILVINQRKVHNLSRLDLFNIIIKSKEN